VDSAAARAKPTALALTGQFATALPCDRAAFAVAQLRTALPAFALVSPLAPIAGFAATEMIDAFAPANAGRQTPKRSAET